MRVLAEVLMALGACAFVVAGLLLVAGTPLWAAVVALGGIAVLALSKIPYTISQEDRR